MEKGMSDLLTGMETVSLNSKAIIESLMVHYEDVDEGPGIDQKTTCLLLNQVRDNLDAMSKLISESYKNMATT